MAKEQPHPAAQPSGRALERWIAANQSRVSLGLLVAAVLFAIIPIVQIIIHFQSPPANVPFGAWGGAMALLCLFGGLYLLFDQSSPGAADRESRYRLLALGLGGLAGLVTFLLGV